MTGAVKPAWDPSYVAGTGLPSSDLRGAKKRLIATLPELENRATHSKHIYITISNRNKKTTFRQRTFRTTLSV
jgi:hypothetical protein